MPPAKNGPDFLCIGMPKAGTAWLFDQIKFHPDFWLPPTKELGYLGREKPRMEKYQKALERGLARPKRTVRGRRQRPWDDRDFGFLREAAALAGQARDLSRYGELFRFKENLKSGDLTPGYCLMPQKAINLVEEHFPDVRVVYLIRDPIARLWSHINLFHNDERFDAALLEDPAAFGAYLDGQQELLNHSRATRTLERWRKTSLQFRHFFFDDIQHAAERTRRDILLFIGADPDKPSGHLPPDYNRKAGHSKLIMSDAIKAVACERLGDEVLACAKLLGGPALDWPARYGLSGA